MGMQLPDFSIPLLAIPSAAPSGNVGTALSVSMQNYVMRPEKWLVTAVVTSAPSDLTLWGALAQGVIDTQTDDIWGLHNDKYGRIVAGKIATALAVGSHHFVVLDLGLYAALYFQRSAGAVDVYVTPILKSGRGS